VVSPKCHEELSVFFIDWQKAFDRVNWTKLMQILKKTGIDWHERRLISNLYMAQSVKVRLNQGERRSMKIGRGVRQGCCLSPRIGFVTFCVETAFYNGLLKERYKGR
jgi:hypothetical protein